MGENLLYAGKDRVLRVRLTGSGKVVILRKNRLSITKNEEVESITLQRRGKPSFSLSSRLVTVKLLNAIKYMSCARNTSLTPLYSKFFPF
jgi:hypothetical protein